MEIVDRYLQAVRFWLPERQRDDIAAELSENIRSQIEEREARLGHPLNEVEAAEILKQHGAPLVVANRFRPPQYLIGPTLYPVYLFVLKIVVVYYMVPWILIWLGLKLSSSTHLGGRVLVAVGPFWTTFWPMAFFIIGGITLSFVLLERSKLQFLEKWDPRKLPPMRDPNKIPRANSITEVTVNLVFLIWMIGGGWYQTHLHVGSVSIDFAPVWGYVLQGFMLLGIANIVAAIKNLVRPYWTWQRAARRAVTDSIAAVLVCWLMRSNFLVALNLANVSTEKTAQIVHGVNLWTARMYPSVATVCTLVVAFSIYRVIRVRARNSRPGALNTVTGLC